MEPMAAQRQAIARADAPQAGPAWRRRGRAAGLVLAFAGVGVLLFLAYLHESRTLPVNSDGAGNALEAWDMLHGNLLLHGWALTDVSFYTTELPQYMLVELARGLGPDVIHVAAAMTYTLLVLLAALLARGRAAGREAAARMLLAGGIMLAPALGVGASVLLSSPDHTGTMVPMLVMWLILDRGGRRWYVPAAAGLILAAAATADTAALLEGTVPVILVCLLRLLRDRRSGQPRRFELALAGSAAASAAVAWLALRLIRSSGGFIVHPVTSTLHLSAALGPHAVNAGKGLLVLFGADFFGAFSGPNPGFYGDQAGPKVATGALHLVGVALAAWALGIALRRCYRQPDFVLAALPVAVLVVIAAYISSGFSANGINMREIAGVLPMTAVLAGRLLPARLAAARKQPGIRRAAAAGLMPVLVAAGAGYAANLAYNASQRPVPPQYHAVAEWLASHHLRYGIGGYWQGASITLGSGTRVTVLTVSPQGGHLAASQWEAKRAWYDPALHYADFAVLSPGRGGLPLARVTAAFGPPAHIYPVAGSLVLTWHENLLTDVAPPPA
jgi:hypothetical protein